MKTLVYSLQGRYHYLWLHPFSVAELDLASPKEIEQLATLGGFPEPFLAGSRTEARRWSREYRTRLIREDLQVSHKAVTRWITILEHLYAIFRLSPFGAPRIRAVKKAQKHYQFDWSPRTC